MFCIHRWTIQKRWLQNETLCTIQRCRRCNKWQREDIIAATSPTLASIERKVIKENEPKAQL